MSLLDKFFVPREEILKLTNRSFEHLSARLETALALESKRLFEGRESELLGTFPGHVVVMSDDGLTHRAYFEETASGEIRFIRTEAVSSSVYSKASLPQFVRKEARSVADMFLRGNQTEGLKRLRALSKLVDGKGSFDEGTTVDGFVQTVLTASNWKKLFAEQSEQMDAVLAESDLAPDSAKKLRAKFFKLYDGSVVGTALEQYRGLVNEDLKHLDGRLAAVLQSGLDSVQRMREISEKNDLSANPTFQTFGSFAEDLVGDVRKVRTSLAETIQGVEGVGALGKMFDTLAEEMGRYERAGAVLSEMTRRLAAAE